MGSDTVGDMVVQFVSHDSEIYLIPYRGNGYRRVYSCSGKSYVMTTTLDRLDCMAYSRSVSSKINPQQTRG